MNLATINRTASTSLSHIRREEEIEQENIALSRLLTRNWKAGDVYAPHDLTGAEARKWRKRTRPTTDAFDALSINPLSLYKNFSVMSEYMTEMGRIRHSDSTGLRPVNQRKIAKAIRRAIALGLMPSVHKHPEFIKVATEGRRVNTGGIYAALPSTTRGQPTPLSTDAKGERIAYASNKSIFLRSIDHPAISTQYTQHTAATTVAKFAPSGFYCASGDASGIVRVWDCSPNGSGTTKGEYAIISGRINDIAWDGDSQRIIAVGDGKQRFGHCITADSGNTVGEISGHSAQVNAVSIRQQRPLRAATAGDDKNLVFYHGAPFKFNGIPGRGKHTNFVYGVAFSPDGNHLLSVGGDKKVYVYDGKTGDVKSEIVDNVEGHKGSIFGVSWSQDSKHFVTCSADRTVKTWDVEAGKVTHTWSFGDAVNVSDQQVGVVWPAGRSDGLLISLSLSGDLNYLYTGSSKPTKILSGHQKNITAMTSSGESESSTLWTGSYEGRLCSWDAASGDAETIEGDGHTNIISGLAATLSGQHPRIYSVGWDDSLRTVDVGARTFTGKPTQLSSQPKALTCTSDSLVVVAQLESVIVYKDGEEDGELPLKSTPTSLASTAGTVAIGSQDSSLRLFSVVPGKAPKQTGVVERVSATPLTAISFSQDGSMVAVGTAAGKIYVYKIRTGVTGLVTETASLELVTDRWSAHTGKITCIAWNPEGTGAVSGSLDTNIFAWSLKEPGKRVKETNAHKEGVNGIVWLGDTVYSTGADATVKKWRIKIA
ncbi:ribosomal protein S18 [Rhinocladiella mackenziei CBS 650.93]|uniref:Small ribosomal subunit protein bS18m n=1 Tax=Rhinocladiella mackenziei CBS 650.93 TaxID=1442369 RepID=A0A0D2H0J7_9EURO|nr:ribosomal protein S18 [Rhinocladiella mackenziei CBS 650.93]KIX03938.1 ribosomal protein S18 [Rhinocladiella mackenziei CBS 650.93]